MGAVGWIDLAKDKDKLWTVMIIVINMDAFSPPPRAFLVGVWDDWGV
jgi:hypothetical protein